MSDPKDWAQDRIDEETIFENDDFDGDGEQDINCGLMANGRCSLEGTEWCDWSCPHAGEALHNSRRRKAARPMPLFEREADQ